jgi:endonuclease/exonuclease/phosphatase family metal-dependent hydrolase
MIICGDMNNSAYSYVYRSIKGSWKIALKRLVKDLEKPISSDIIQLELTFFADEKWKWKIWKLPQFINSDHFPIMARLSLSDHKSVFYLILRRWFFK